MDILTELREKQIFSPRVLDALDQPLFRENASIGKFKKGQIIIQQDEVPENIYILVDGIIRGFLTKKNGQDITDSIIFTRGLIIRPIIKSGDPSLMNYQVLAESTLLMVPTSVAVELVESNMEVMRQSLYSSNVHLKNHRQLKIAHQVYPAKERYEWFCREYGHLVGKIQNRVIASMIGVTPETLSRIQHAKQEEE